MTTRNKKKDITFDCENFAKIEIDRSKDVVCIKCAKNSSTQNAKCIERVTDAVETLKRQNISDASDKTVSTKRVKETALFVIAEMKAKQKCAHKDVTAKFSHVSENYAKSLINKIKGIHKACTHINDTKVDTVYKKCVVSILTEKKIDKKHAAMMRTAKRFYSFFLTQEEIAEYKKAA